jgi:hypothetical protein
MDLIAARVRTAMDKYNDGPVKSIERVVVGITNNTQVSLGVGLRLAREIAPKYWDEFVELLWKLVPITDYARDRGAVHLQLLKPCDGNLSKLSWREMRFLIK